MECRKGTENGGLSEIVNICYRFYISNAVKISLTNRWD